MKIQDLLQGINLAVMLAFNGKPLEFKQEWETPIGEIPTFHSAGTSRKPRKSDVEIGADGKITDRQRAAWEAEGLSGLVNSFEAPSAIQY